MIVVPLLGTAFGLAHRKPIGCAVACAFEAGRGDKGLGQVDGVSINLFSVFAELLDTQRQQL